MNCDCIESINKKILETKPNLGLETATSYSQKTGKLNTVPRMYASKLDKSIRKGSKGLTIFPTYCPFCGVKVDLHE